jgi:hypothetical protein
MVIAGSARIGNTVAQIKNILIGFEDLFIVFFNISVLINIKVKVELAVRFRRMICL